MLLMLAVYAGATALQLQMHTLILGFGALVTLGMVLICITHRAQWFTRR